MGVHPLCYFPRGNFQQRPLLPLLPTLPSKLALDESLADMMGKVARPPPFLSIIRLSRLDVSTFHIREQGTGGLLSVLQGHISEAWSYYPWREELGLSPTRVGVSSGPYTWEPGTAMPQPLPCPTIIDTLNIRLEGISENMMSREPKVQGDWRGMHPVAKTVLGLVQGFSHVPHKPW